MMTRYVCTIGAALLLVALAYVYAQTAQPANGPELAQQLYDELGIECSVDRDGNIVAARIERDTDVRRAVNRLSNVNSLKELWLQGAHVDQRLLEALRSLPKLEIFKLQYCKFADNDLKALKELRMLKELDLTGTPVTDAGMIYLRPLKELHTLRLDGTKVTGTSFDHLQALPRLRSLTIRGTPLTDKGAAEIGKIRTLQVLRLSNTPLTDNGLRQLTDLYQLFEFAIVDTKVTEAGKQAFLEGYAKSRAEAAEKNLLPKNHPELQLTDK